MRALGLEREPQPLVRARAHARIDTRDDRALAHARVEQDLGAERLHHLDGGIEGVVAGCVRARRTQRLGTQPEDGALAAVAAQGLRLLRRHAHAQPGCFRPQCIAARRDRDGDEVHGRRADKAGDEAVRGVLVELERLAFLLHHAVLHHHHAVAERHGFHLVVRHVDGRGLQPVVEALQFHPHLHA